MSDQVDAILGHPNLPNVIARLVGVEAAGHDFDVWCEITGRDTHDEAAWDEFEFLHETYILLWHDLGTETFWGLIETERRRQEALTADWARETERLEKKQRKVMEKVRL